MDVRVKRCPCFLRGSFTCANALCQSRSLGSSFSIPLSFRHFWIASVYFICLFFLDGSMFLFNLILSKKRVFVTLPFPFLERISPGLEGAFHFFAPSACLSMRGEKVCLPHRY